VKKEHLMDQTLRNHLKALQELPADAIVHPTLVLTRGSGEEVLEAIAKARPTEPLRDLLRDGN
jgi:hypothetical protein